MQNFFRIVREFVRKADMLLLTLCVMATVYGVVIISSATNYLGNARYIRTQLLALLLGIICYVVLTLIDVDIIAERREILIIACVVFISTLFIWGHDEYGNRSWLAFSWLPFNIQPAELCKIPFILILAKIMSVKQGKISSPLTVARIGGITVFFFALIMAASNDLGVALQYLLIFVIMAFAGGVSLFWFLCGLAAILAASPILWTHLSDYQQNRILVLFDPSIDPEAQTIRYQMNRSLRALQNGGITGQGLYNGTMVQSGSLPQQRNDFIFSACGEELGMLGCAAILLLLTFIILRIVRVGVRSENYMNKLICIGIAGMLFSQILINVGMCLGLLPVIGLTLPFFSYGGSSIVTMFLSMGIVSGIYMRPAPDSNARYIRPKT